MINIGERLGGGRFDGDLVSEGFEFADESPLTGIGTVDTTGEVIRAEIAVGGGLGEHMPDDHNKGVRGGGSGLLPTLLAEPAVEVAELGADVGAGTSRVNGQILGVSSAGRAVVSRKITAM